jgi:hypothetical protein
VALNFAKHGHLRSSLLAPYSFANLPDVNRVTYWQLPTYLIGLGIWFRAVPVSAECMRFFSVLWGCVFGISWFIFVRSLSRNENLALLVASTVLLDSSCVAAASDGRMDMMCAALGQAALASYVSLRNSRAPLGMFVAGVFGATSLFCHPMGAVTNAFLAVLLVTDRRALSWKKFAILSVPYWIAGALYVRYIGKAPGIFWPQIRGVSGYRLRSPWFLLRNIVFDFQDRYLHFYFAPHSGWHKLKIFLLLFGLFGFICLASDRKLRTATLPKLMLAFACVGYLGVAAIDNQRFPCYLIFFTPVLSACGATWLYLSFRHQRRSRGIALTLLAAFFLATIGGTVYYVRRNDYKNEYDPMVHSVKSNVKPGDIIMGPSELGFALGFAPPLIDDCSLGFTSGIRPKVYVLYPACEIPGYSMDAWNWSHRETATHYHPVLQNDTYTVYVHN